MPPKAKITKEMILNTVLQLTRDAGFERVNARSIGNKLNCSTRPIFTCYESMDELKQAFLAFAYEYYERYTANFDKSQCINPCLVLPLSYIEFAWEEPHLFKLLFIDDMDLNMTEAKDFYNERDNEKRAGVFSETLGMDLEKAKAVFLDLFLYTHGIAVLTVTRKFVFSRENAENMLTNMLSAFIKQEKPLNAAGREREGL